MAATIYEHSGSDKHLRVTKGQIARKLPFGSSWSTLRLAIRCAMHDTGSNLSGGAGNLRFALGVCAGTSQVYGDPVVQHFVGVGTPDTVSWQRSTSGIAVNYQTESTLGLVPFTAEGTNYLIQSGYLRIQRFSANPVVHGVLIAEIAKSTGDVNALLHTTLTVGITSDQLATAIKMGTPALTGCQWRVAGGITIDEGTYGALESVCFHWNQLNPPFELCEIMYYKVA